MPGEQVGSAFATIGLDASALNSGLNVAKASFSSAVDSMQTNLTKGSWNKVGGTIGNDLVSGITAPLGSLSGVASSVVTAIGPVGIVAAGAVAGAAVIGAAASKAAMEWDAGMSKISKTTGIEKGTGGFENLNSDLKDLYATMPTTVSEIQNVASSAGSLGIAKSEIAGFTQVALQMGSAFDIPAEQAAVSVGKIKSQLKSYSDEVKDASGAVNDSKFAQHFGSAVDFAGNELNATESEVLDFSIRTAGAFSNLGGNMYELAGWGGELASVFSSSELASGSFNAALNQLMGTTKGSENARAKAGELLGVTPEEFQELMTNDPTDTLLNIGKAMEGLSDTERFQAAGILGGGYGDDFFQKMVGKTEEWRGKIDEVVAAGEKGESIGTSYAAGADNAKSALQMLKNSVGAVLTDIGGPINAAITPVITAAASGLNKIRTVGENLWGPFTTAISPATAAVGLLAEGVGAVGSISLDVLVGASEAINEGFQVGSAFVSAFGEELADIVTSSSTFQTLSGYVDQVGTAFDNLATGAGEVFDKIVDGLSNAIPTAISGAASAVGTLFDKAGLGGVTDAASGVAGFLGDVYDNAAEKLGWGVEKGTEEGMEKGSDAAKDGIEKSTKESVAAGAEAGFDDAAKAYWSNIENLQRQGIQSGYALSAYPGMVVSSDSSSDSSFRGTAKIGNNEIKSTFTESGQWGKYSLYMVADNGESILLAEENYKIGATNSADAIRKLAAKNLITSGASESEILSLADMKLQAAEAEIEIDTDAYLDFATNLKSEMAGAGEEIGNAFASGLVPSADTIDSRLDAIRRLKLYDPEEYERQGAEAAEDYLISLQSALDAYEAAKIAYIAEPNENTLSDFKKTFDQIQAVADQNKIKLKIEPEDNYIEVLTAYFKNNGNVDWNALGVSNPSRYLDYAKQQLASEVSGYAEQGRIVPEGETRDMFTSLQSWFHANYASLDSVNRASSALLDQAIAKGGLYWDALYAQMGLLSTDIKTAGTVAGTAIETKSAAGAQKIFDASGSFKIGTDAAGRDIAVIGSQVRSDGVAGGQAVADGCQTGANTLVNAFSSIGSIVGAVTSSALSNLFNSAAAKSNVAYPIAATTKTASLGFTAGSDLNNFGGVPKGWTSAVSDASVATQGAVAQTNNLTSGVTALDGTSGTCASSVSGLNSELSQFHVLAATTATTLATSSASLATSNNLLQYTAEGVSDSMYDCECAISDFAKAQESTPGLFYSSYIGPTSGYSGVAGGGAATSMSSYSLPPVFSFANEGYVPSPTLAVIGDRPGGEYVVGAARFENAMGKMGQGVTINVTQNINGSGLSAAELEYVLERNNKALVAEITDAAKGF